jgi:hypothetical protein
MGTLATMSMAPLTRIRNPGQKWAILLTRDAVVGAHAKIRKHVRFQAAQSPSSLTKFCYEPRAQSKPGQNSRQWKVIHCRATAKLDPRKQLSLIVRHNCIEVA